MALQWEVLETRNQQSKLTRAVMETLLDQESVKRAKVPGGWLVSLTVGKSVTLTFYPDPSHLWDGSSLD